MKLNGNNKECAINGSHIKKGDNEQINKPLPAANKILNLSIDTEIRFYLNSWNKIHASPKMDEIVLDRLSDAINQRVQNSLDSKVQSLSKE